MKNASIEKIVSVVPHPNADRLDLVTILGFQCADGRGLHQPGDVVVYIQPDSLLPELPWAVGYRKYSPSRIKAVKLRNEWSEGIVVKFEQLPSEFQDRHAMSEIGTDVSEFLGVTHWEPPLPNNTAAKGALPFGIPKTDEERWENMVGRLPIGEMVDVTLKVDGQSWSAYYNVVTKEFGVLGRSLEYKLIEGFTNAYVAQLERYGIKEKLIGYCEKHNVSLCIRGESYGPSIQKFGHNPHTKGAHGLAIFGVWSMNERRRIGFGEDHYFRDLCAELDLPAVTILESRVVLTDALIQKYSVGLKALPNGDAFEGVVINHAEYKLPQAARSYVNADNETVQIEPFVKTFMAGSFKVINKHYDSKK